MVGHKRCFIISIFTALLLVIIVPGMYLFGYNMDMHREDSYYLSIICNRLSIDMENPDMLGTILDKQYDYARDFHLEAVVQLTDEGLAFIAQHAQKTPILDKDTVSILKQCGGMLVLEELENIREKSEMNGRLWLANRWNSEDIITCSEFDFCLIDEQNKEMLYFGVEW